MKNHLLLVFATALLIAPGIGLAQSPREVGPFVLGRSIAEFKENVNMGSALPVRHSEFIKEVEIQDVDGFKSGLIGFGTCEAVGKLLRVKLKYTNKSRAFYEKVLKRFKNKFGQPEEWRGDPFHIVRAWKWSFNDDAGNRTSMILQHNTRDVEEKIGNAVKLTMTSQLEKEEACFEKKYPGFRRKGKNKTSKWKMSAKDWERFVPR